MTAIRIVVCPVDFSPATARQLDLAIDVCRAFGARLVVHHNVTDLSVGAGVGWMWHSGRTSPSSTSVDDQLRSLLDRVPAGIDVESCITRGAVTEAVLTVSDAAEADLIVLSAHAGKTEDHASVIEYLLEHSRRAVLVLHDPGADVALPKFVPDDTPLVQALLVPTNLTGESHAQVEFACGLARMFPLRLHLLHVIEAKVARQGRDADPAAIRLRLEALVPADLVASTTVHVESGETVPAIAQAAKGLSVSCIVMGEHTRIPVKRWLTQDTSRAVLREAPCPVWYVPSPPADLSFSRFALSTKKSIFWGNV